VHSSHSQLVRLQSHRPGLGCMALAYEHCTEPLLVRAATQMPLQVPQCSATDSVGQSDRRTDPAVMTRPCR